MSFNFVDFELHGPCNANCDFLILQSTFLICLGANQSHEATRTISDHGIIILYVRRDISTPQMRMTAFSTHEALRMLSFSGSVYQPYIVILYSVFECAYINVFYTPHIPHEQAPVYTIRHDSALSQLHLPIWCKPLCNLQHLLL